MVEASSRCWAWTSSCCICGVSCCWASPGAGATIGDPVLPAMGCMAINPELAPAAPFAAKGPFNGVATPGLWLLAGDANGPGHWPCCGMGILNPGWEFGSKHSWLISLFNYYFDSCLGKNHFCFLASSLFGRQILVGQDKQSLQLFRRGHSVSYPSTTRCPPCQRTNPAPSTRLIQPSTLQ